MIRRAPRPSSGYVTLRNEIARDARLSYKARGLLTAILSRPDNWEITSDALAAESAGDGRDAVRSGLKELRKVGYARVFDERDARGRLERVYEIYDEPLDAPIASIDVFNPQSTGDESTTHTVTNAQVTPKTDNPSSVETPAASAQVTPKTGFPAPDEPTPEQPAPGNPARIEVPKEEIPPPSEAAELIDGIEPDPPVDNAHAFVDALQTRVPSAPRWLGRHAIPALEAGWSIDAIVDAILVEPLDSARSVPAVLARRLGELGAPTSTATRPETPWCGLCERDTRLRSYPSTDGRDVWGRCDVCHPLRLEVAS